ncbi:MAG TPA: PfkB family carbohydrate kinase [Candidatus Acidoferrales bacterium]|jgi:D-beta-D-heptose 7-phosphate kinase/D-beta-D-heptose 1-phosphate adenosyltransferase|nr:PfkB family carbohydrate kinase [Candidatus Acidoferrales bacterium]
MPKSKREKFSRSRLTRIVKSFRGRRLGVLGDWMLDRYLWGRATRLSPEAAVPVVEFEKEELVLGGAGNVAANLTAYGAKIVPFGASGNDDSADALRRMVRKLDMAEKGIVEDSARPTTLKTRIIAHHQQIVRVDRETRAPLRAEIEELLIRRTIAALPRLHALVLSDYDKGVVTDEVAARVLGACAKLGVKSFVKPKWSMLATYPGATVIVLNRGEASFLVSRALDDDASIEQAAVQLSEKFKCPGVVITRGEKGMTILEHDAAKAVHIPAASQEPPVGRLGERAHMHSTGRQVFDVTGAGDTVLATLALGISAGASLREAAMMANAAAGVVVGKLGTATVSPAELLAALGDLSSR